MSGARSSEAAGCRFGLGGGVGGHGVPVGVVQRGCSVRAGVVVPGAA
ncbi:MAG: hypothetical protein HPY45_17335 [Anaerolineae bacterium]|nr:hypothetical protein [Anaerolineae bacterium]